MVVDKWCIMWKLIQLLAFIIGICQLLVLKLR